MIPFDSWKHQYKCEKVCCGLDRQVESLVQQEVSVFEGKIHFVGPIKGFLSRFTRERSKNVYMLWPYALVMIDSTKEAVHLQEIFCFCICKIL